MTARWYHQAAVLACVGILADGFFEAAVAGGLMGFAMHPLYGPIFGGRT
jgi:hypothetical protein